LNEVNTIKKQTLSDNQTQTQPQAQPQVSNEDKDKMVELDKILNSLNKVGEMVDSVLVELVFRDIENLFTVFMNQMVKSMTISNKNITDSLPTPPTSSSSTDQASSLTDQSSDSITDNPPNSLVVTDLISHDFGISDFASDFFAPTSHDEHISEEF